MSGQRLPVFLAAFVFSCWAQTGTLKKPVPAHIPPALPSLIDVLNSQDIRAMRENPGPPEFVDRTAPGVVDDLGASAFKWMLKLPPDPKEAARQALINRHYIEIGELFKQIVRTGAGRLDMGTDRLGRFVYAKGDVPVQFAAKDGGLVILVTGLISTVAYNTQRLTVNARAAEVVSSIVLPNIVLYAPVLREAPFQYYGMVVTYRVKDFLSDSFTESELIAFIAPASLCVELSSGKTTDADLLKAADVFLRDRNSVRFRKVAISIR